MFDNPTSLFQQKLKESMKVTSDSELIQELIKLHLFKNSEKDESLLWMVELYNLVGLELFTQIIDLMNGRSVKFPKKNDFKDTINQALCYYYRTIENKSWAEIKEILGQDLKTVKMGIKNSQFDHFVQYLINKGVAKNEQKRS